MRAFWTVSFWIVESTIVLVTIPLVLFVYLPLVVLKAVAAAVRAMTFGRGSAEPRPAAGPDA
jgi:hypothetical protein